MESIKGKMLYHVKRLKQVDNFSEANDFLEFGWILLNIRNLHAEDFEIFTLGWPHKTKPEYPEQEPVGLYIEE